MSSNRHKMYRSQTGCCICRVKSSSSRFTSSERYERDFRRCFHVANRSGDICNACVLLVKRWRMRKDKDRHWEYVVDLRLNPGARSILKRKKRQTKVDNQTGEPRKHGVACSCDICEGIRSVGHIVAKRRERKRREKEEALMESDGHYWRIYMIPCGCGPVLIGRANEIMVDEGLMKWCRKPGCYMGNSSTDQESRTGTRESSLEIISDSAASASSNELDF
ncbi:Hypothetical predicted protein [Octopus vulgaris]|nr:SIN3-HDAC complex-associated factor-like [Octopus sinensis]CAI9738255.1 Hypothetical predicted protein [Octopus vulgaris]